MTMATLPAALREKELVAPASAPSGAGSESETRKALPNCLPGAVVAQYRKRGDHTFGPYWFRVWRVEGRLHKAYVRPADLEATRAACARSSDRRRRRSADRASAGRTMKDFTFLGRMLTRLETAQDDHGDGLDEGEVARLARILSEGIGR